MGNAHTKSQFKNNTTRKQVRWRAAERPGSPGKPELVSSDDVTPDVVTIRWEKSKFDGGSPITGYLVEHRRTGSPHWIRSTSLLVPTPELSLSGLEPGWRYQFRVSAQNSVGLSSPGEVSEPLTVTLQRNVITAPKFTEELKDSTALENEMIEFIVHVVGQPIPKICWFKDGFEIFSSRRTRITTDNDRSSLTIHQAALADEGEIKCTATNRAGHASSKAILKIEAPPKLRPPKNYEDGLLFELDEVIRLKVSIAGLPQPLVFWTHNGESIQNDERFEISEGDKCSILRIAAAQRSDRGEYQIRAVNKLGEDATSFLVTVTDKPKPPQEVKVAMSLGKSVTLCWMEPEDDGGCKIGNYIVEYYRVGWNVWLKAATCRQLSFTLSELIEGSEYKFRIKAENPYGVSDPSDETDVIFIPDPKRGLLFPPARSRSQPRELADVPIPPKRRSTSSTRASTRDQNNLVVDTVPLRPKREKLPTSNKSTETSPKETRRNTAINTTFIDRASLSRELSYGIDLKSKKEQKKAEPTPNLLKVSPEKSPTRGRNKSPVRFNIVSNERKYSLSPDISPDKSPSPTRSKINSFLTSIIPGRRSSSPSILPTDRKPSITIDTNADLTPSPKDEIIIEEPVSVDENLKSPYYSDRRGSFHRRSVSPNPDRSPSPSKLVPNNENLSRRGSTLSKQNDMSHGSSEFMLVLFPGHGDKYNQDHGSSYLGDSMIPPPMSLSAPELGNDPDMFPPLKKSASSTELLLERAFARFAQAEDEEERQRAAENTDRKPSVPKILINSMEDDTIERRPSLRRRLSSGITNMAQQYIWAKRRRSLRNPAELAEMKEISIPEDIPDIQENHQVPDKREEIIEKKFKVEESKTEKDYELSEADRLEMEREEAESEEETESEESDDERLKYEITPPNVIAKEQETYHPRMMLPKNTSDDPFEILTKPSPLPDPNFVPKPILKRPEELKLIPDNPERRTMRSEDESTMDHPASPIRKVAPMCDLSDQLISAGEAARNKRMVNRQSSHEETKVVADYYADLVREYGGGMRRFQPRPVPKEEPNENQIEENKPPYSAVVTRRDPNPSVVNRRNASPAVRTRTASPAVTNRRPETPTVLSKRTASPDVSNRHRSTVNNRISTEIITRDVTEKRKPRSRSTSRTREGKRTIPAEIQAKLNNLPKTPSPTPEQAELLAAAEIRVRSTLDYLTDLAMFIVAFWFYLFSDPRLAIPIMLVMVYRQIQDAVNENIPAWLRKKAK